MSKPKISFEVPSLPVSKSNMYGVAVRGKFGSIYKKKQCKDFEALVADCADEKKQSTKWILTEDSVFVKVKILLPDQRRRDLDNALKSLLDAMNGIIYKDDTQVFKIEAEKVYKKGCEPTIKIQVGVI